MTHTHHTEDFTEATVRRRLTALIDRAGYWQPGTDLLSGMALARLALPVNGHTQIITCRVPLFGINDPGIGRLMLFDALGDAVAERHPVTGVFLP
jgi:hypothetical protein